MSWNALFEGAKMVTSIAVSKVDVKFKALVAPTQSVRSAACAVVEKLSGIVRTLSMTCTTPPL